MPDAFLEGLKSYGALGVFAVAMIYAIRWLALWLRTALENNALQHSQAQEKYTSSIKEERTIFLQTLKEERVDNRQALTAIVTEFKAMHKETDSKVDDLAVEFRELAGKLNK